MWSPHLDIQRGCFWGDPHDQERFRRRKRHAFMGGHAYLPSPEDVPVQMMRWYSRAKRPKDPDDIKSVLGVQHGNLDLPYIRQWTAQHGTRDLLERLLTAVQGIL